MSGIPRQSQLLLAYTAACPVCQVELLVRLGRKASATTVLLHLTKRHRIERPKCPSGYLLLPMLSKFRPTRNRKESRP
jgi:hypothetical protein